MLDVIGGNNTKTYKMRMNLIIEMGSDPFDYLELYYFELKEGETFDGNQKTITINNSLGLGTYLNTTTHADIIGKGQSGLFKIPHYKFFDLSGNNQYLPRYLYEAYLQEAVTGYKKDSGYVTIKNLRYIGTAAIKTHTKTSALAAATAKGCPGAYEVLTSN